jgi:plasmid maintenance system killer protein
VVIPQARRTALLTSDTSRVNKIWIAQSWGIPWRWKGRALRSEIEIELNGKWCLCDSIEAENKREQERPMF